MVVRVCGVEFGMTTLRFVARRRAGSTFPEQQKQFGAGALSAFRKLIRLAKRCAFSRELTVNSAGQYSGLRRAPGINVDFCGFSAARGKPGGIGRRSKVAIEHARSCRGNRGGERRLLSASSQNSRQQPRRQNNTAGDRAAAPQYREPALFSASAYRRRQFRQSDLMMTCIDGSATAAQGVHKARWQRGQTLPFSPNARSQL